MEVTFNYDDIPSVSGIYKIVFENDKVYVGKTVDLNRRTHEHFNRDLKQHPDLKLSRAIKLHSVKTIELIEPIPYDATPEIFNNRECYWIAQYNSYENGYNMTKGGDGGAWGLENVASKLTERDLETICYDLQYTDKRYDDILKEVPNASRIVITGINTGKHYYNPEYTYPLRKERAEHYGLNNLHSAFYGREQELYALIQDLKTSPLSIKELQVKYNIGSQTISLINSGQKYHQENEQYPLRINDHGAKAQIKLFSADQLDLIKDKLENSDLTMTEIGALVGRGRGIISEINNGTRQHNEAWDYPLRKKRLKTGPKPKTR